MREHDAIETLAGLAEKAGQMVRCMVEWLARLSCRFGHCWSCRTWSTYDGVGGRCIRCGRIHGWVTRAELRDHINRSEMR